MLKDPCGRSVETIRISITQLCNLRCFYCHQEGEARQDITEMTSSEIQRIVKLATSFGIRKVKLTGGEPLLRKDIIQIIAKIKATVGVREVSMTTNGILLAGYANRIKEAGLARVNVSLDTLNLDRFREITGENLLNDVITGLRSATKAGLSPVKVNMVLLKEVNENEISDMIAFVRANGLSLQVIEYETPIEDKIYDRYHVDLDQLESYIKSISNQVMVRRMHHRRKYYLCGGGEVEIVRPMHNSEFCRYCNRIRVTSNGKLKPCLFRNDNLIDFVGPLRKGAPEKKLKELFIKAVQLREPYFT